MLRDAEAEQWLRGSVEFDSISPFNIEGFGHIRNIAQGESEQQH